MEPLYALDAGWPLARREARDMNAPDLRMQPPPRWNVEVDGIVWLPRFSAKCRAHRAGMLGAYLFGQSPIDDAFLRKSGLTYAEFEQIVASADDDRAILAAIEARTPGTTARLRRWSERLATTQRVLLAVIDIDDGYASGGWRTVFHTVCGPVINQLMRVVRAARPLPR